ncbi:PREDICTED: uncharacterized protein LOC105560166 [Vollenhovia emeryi]|uniref:uncharacterized protein LOC105560166 n=1 Tax=Vollenhovia emeryi TaxID=411798 RepID=UPI0005F573A7|nr:PREDICTED: uncharacterized protein LOC105560166 [Vollenhovia emeryi]
MRIVVAALCFSAVLCTVYAPVPPKDDLDDVKLEILTAKQSVERTIQQIKRVFTDTKEDTMLTIMKRWWEQMDTYRNYINLMIESMRREVHNAKLYKGVDAQYCFDTNSGAINEHTDVAYKTAVTCQEKGGKSIESSLSFLDSLVSLGEGLIKELDHIFLNCHDDDPVKNKSCILDEFTRINTAVKEFEEDANKIEYSALPASNYVVLQATQCLTNAYLLARFESQGAMASHSRCVRDAIDRSSSGV